MSNRRAGDEAGLKKVAEFGSETKRKHPSAPSARPAFRSALDFFGRARRARNFKPSNSILSLVIGF